MQQANWQAARLPACAKLLAQAFALGRNSSAVVGDFSVGMVAMRILCMLAAALAAQGADAAGFLTKAAALGTDGALPTVNVHYDFASEDVADGGAELARAAGAVCWSAAFLWPLP